MAKLVYYYGSMNSSKSAQLIMTLHNFEQQGKKTLVFKSAIDTRDTHIKSRAVNREVEAIVVEPSAEGFIYETGAFYITTENTEFVFVDEVQFLSVSQVEELSDLVDNCNVDVICYGLLTDFKGELFPASKKLVEHADSIREIKNQCYQCKNKANRNLRLVNDTPVFEGETVQVGAEESYRSVCRKCYKALEKASCLYA
jgi:thymidine kinase